MKTATVILKQFASSSRVVGARGVEACYGGPVCMACQAHGEEGRQRRPADGPRRRGRRAAQGFAPTGWDGAIASTVRGGCVQRPCQMPRRACMLREVPHRMDRDRRRRRPEQPPTVSDHSLPLVGMTLFVSHHLPDLMRRLTRRRAALVNVLRLHPIHPETTSRLHPPPPLPMHTPLCHPTSPSPRQRQTPQHHRASLKTPMHAAPKIAPRAPMPFRSRSRSLTELSASSRRRFLASSETRRLLKTANVILKQ